MRPSDRGEADALAGMPVLNWRAFLLLLAGACAIGLAGILVRTSEVGPIASAFWRLAIACAVLWGIKWAGLRNADVALSTAPPPRALLLAAGVFFALDLSFWHWALWSTSVANATLESNLAPFFVVMGLWFFLGQRPAWQVGWGLVLALSGAFCLVFPGQGQSPVRSELPRWAGDLSGVLSAVFYAVYQYQITKARQTASTLDAMAWSTLASTLVFALVCAFTGEPFLPHSLRGWALVIALALVCQLGGQVVIAHASGRLPLSVSSVGLLMQPVAATGFAWWLLGEGLQTVQWLGVGLVLCGIYVCKKSGAADVRSSKVDAERA